MSTLCILDTFKAISAFTATLQLLTSEKREENRRIYHAIARAWNVLKDIDAIAAEVMYSEMEIWVWQYYSWDWINPGMQPADLEASNQRYHKYLHYESSLWIEDILAGEVAVLLIEDVLDFDRADARYNAILGNLIDACARYDQRIANLMRQVMKICFPSYATKADLIYSLHFNADQQNPIQSFVDTLD